MSKDINISLNEREYNTVLKMVDTTLRSTGLEHYVEIRSVTDKLAQAAMEVNEETGSEG